MNLSAVQNESKRQLVPFEPDINKKNCSIIINDLRELDSGSTYKFQFKGSRGLIFAFVTNITVRALSQKPTVKPLSLRVGEPTTLTCTAPGRCSGTPPSITWMLARTGEDPHITNYTIDVKTENLTNIIREHSSTLTFTPSADNNGRNVTCVVTFMGNISATETVTLNVSSPKETNITGNAPLNLICTRIKVYPPTRITRTEERPNKTNMTTPGIPMVTEEYSRRYKCEVQHMKKNLTVYADITVTYPKETNITGNATVNDCEGLKLICTSIEPKNETNMTTPGIPMVTEGYSRRYKCKVQHMKNLTVNAELTVMFNSTINLPVKKPHDITVQCVNSNQKGDGMEEKDKNRGVLSYVTRLETIIAFLIGVVLSATICCLTRTCRRTKERDPRSPAEPVEMVTCPGQQSDAGQEPEDDQTHQQQESLGDRSQGAEPKEVNYANIDYSALRKRSPGEAEEKPGTADTEYAEIKKGGAAAQDDSGEESEMFKVEEEEEAMVGEHEKACEPEEEESEDVALYSNVKDIMDKE
ncbi:sialic acid-binding Ig-like lectin 5 [Polymixia lowei]